MYMKMFCVIPGQPWPCCVARSARCVERHGNHVAVVKQEATHRWHHKRFSREWWGLEMSNRHRNLDQAPNLNRHTTLTRPPTCLSPKACSKLQYILVRVGMEGFQPSQIWSTLAIWLTWRTSKPHQPALFSLVHRPDDFACEICNLVWLVLFRPHDLSHIVLSAVDRHLVVLGRIQMLRINSTWCGLFRFHFLTHTHT